ncbi:hypothetical protein [Chryseobacterium bernardetii]|uniref:Uncharacterized protein n=1 Tax=Chryseobacterium bernardetii TaxID=1241978 RepID=A0A3G6TYX3_9FLAO|nr:hypothetical protein [Chryseobacterium bernardetii]AZB26737.1 hypothetical protein EG339_20175 [Chryseobacterium bernardetii]AZB33217.1 hypothetical protein EG351_06025 [Chryseobacterium bernardetii]
MNYVTVIYLLNVLVYAIYFFGKGGSETDVTLTDYFVSALMSLLLILAGYLGARQNKTYRSALWMFFINVLFFVMSGLFDQFGNNFNILSTSSGDSFIFTLALIIYNGYLFPLIVTLDRSGFALVLPVILSFILPSLGYWIGKVITMKKSIS